MVDPSSKDLAPFDFRAEVADYDRTAEVRQWRGPRHRMTYRVLGDGPALVLVPGLASTYRGYGPTLNRLAGRFQTIQLDYPGENPDDGANLREIAHEDLVDDLFGLLDHLGLARAYPFGLSFGSTITLKALHRDPSRFPKAALQGGFARRKLMPAERVAARGGSPDQGERPRGCRSTIRAAAALNNRATLPADLYPDLLRVHYVEENGLTPIASLTHRLDRLDRLDLRPILPEIRTEILVIHGTADRIVPMARHKELVVGLARPTAVLMDGVGHQPHWTHPRELADLVGDFFKEGL